jgi:CheY-like chemotaxis protein
VARILIAEDDAVSQQVTCRIARGLGHEAYVSPNGRHAYEALKAPNNFELLVTDIMMPEMDGRQLIQTLRGDTSFQKLPIIIMSAVCAMADVSGLLGLGPTDFVTKPIQAGELERLISGFLGGGSDCQQLGFGL